MTTCTKLPLHILLLLGIPRNVPPLHEQTLAPPDAVHVPLGHVLTVAVLAEILEVVLGEGHPEGVLVEDLEAREDKLGLGGARSALAHLVGEAKGLSGREEGLDGEKGGAFLHGFGEDVAASASQNVVDTTKYLGCVVVCQYLLHRLGKPAIWGGACLLLKESCEL